MNLPLNGRIAIIDNELNQAIPLMRVFAKNSLPYVFYKADDLDFLPEEGQALNDIRILFLDINLLNERTANEKEIRGALISVLKRVISKNNFPYSLIFWSRQESEFSQLVNDIFLNELSDRKPINLLPFVKSDFFPDFANEEHPTQVDIIQSLRDILAQHHAYSYLLSWENLIHISTDQTLQEIFSAYHEFEDWNNNANYILKKLGISYLGKHFADCSSEEKIQASFISLNAVFQDTLEHMVYDAEIENAAELEADATTASNNPIEINKKLNFSYSTGNISEPGNILEFKEDGKFPDILNRLVSIFQLKKKIQSEKIGISDAELKKELKSEFKRIKTEISGNWIKLGVVVTPVCDYVQKDNRIYDRIVCGLLIEEVYKDFIEEKSEAVFTFPFTVQHNGRKYILVLDFRHFITLSITNDDVTPLFRLRHELLSEIQSRLARHITRQGILFLDER